MCLCHNLPTSALVYVIACQCQNVVAQNLSLLVLCLCHNLPTSALVYVIACQCQNVVAQNLSLLVLCLCHNLPTSALVYVIACQCQNVMCLCHFHSTFMHCLSMSSELVSCVYVITCLHQHSFMSLLVNVRMWLLRTCLC